MPAIPQAPLEIMEESLAALDERLALRIVEGPTTHIAIVDDDLGHGDVPDALGRYLVGVVAGAVDIDAELSEELLASTPDSAAEVREHIHQLIGDNNTFVTDQEKNFRDTVRNP